MKEIGTLILTSVISSGIVGFIFKQFFLNSFEIKLANYKQDLNKELQRHTLYEQTKHEVYREYFKLLMIAQSTVLLNVNVDKGRRAFNVSKIDTLMDLNNYVYSNSLYFSDDLFQAIEDLQELIQGLIMKKEKITVGKTVDIEQLEKDIKIMQQKVKEMRVILKNELI